MRCFLQTLLLSSLFLVGPVAAEESADDSGVGTEKPQESSGKPAAEGAEDGVEAKGAASSAEVPEEPPDQAETLEARLPEAGMLLLAEPEMLSALSEGLRQQHREEGLLSIESLAVSATGSLTELETSSAAATFVLVGGPLRFDFPPRRPRSAKPGGVPADDPVDLFISRAAETLDQLAARGGYTVARSLVPPGRRKWEKKLSQEARDRVGTLCDSRPRCDLSVQDGSASTDQLAASLVTSLRGKLAWEVPVAPAVERWDDAGRLIEPALLSEERLFIRRSELRGKEVRYWAFVPQREALGETYPVLYLLHGATGTYRDWRKHARGHLLDLAAKYGLIIVTPDGDSHGWYLDSPEDEDSQLESYFLKELIPHVEGESGLPVAGGEGHRAIAGLSMGGHGALVLALRNTGTFVTASSMSGILDLMRHPRSWEIAERLGSRNKNNQLWQEHSATQLLRERGRGELRLLFSCGDSDSAAWEDNLALHEELLEAGVEHEWSSSSAGHSWDYWISLLPEHVAFAAEFLRGDGER
ncbi:MAG: alpha/beta hydrolase family protein [Myxococcota bacterium]|nr:alpha/beta hydrolase family protein [Myxococcota bacterium]